MAKGQRPGLDKTFNFIGLAPESRSRIYSYYFEDCIIRLTKAVNRDKARVYYKSKVALMLTSKAIYLETHPLYWSNAVLTLKNTRLGRFHNITEPTPLRFVQQIELIDLPGTALDTSNLPALKTLKLSFEDYWRDGPVFQIPGSLEEVTSYIEGEYDNFFKAQAKSSILSTKRRSLQRFAYDSRPKPDIRWLRMLIGDPTRQFQITDELHITLHYNELLRSDNGSLSHGQAVRKGSVKIRYDIDTLETLVRLWKDTINHTLRIWANGKDDVYKLKAGKMGQLLSSRTIKKEVSDPSTTEGA